LEYRTWAAVAALGVALAGCSMSSIPGMSPLFTGGATGTDASAAATPSFECPSVDVRAGAGTLAISANAADQSPMNMRYQVGIGQTARECKLVGTTVTMKVGIQGRVVLGPAGTPGQIDVPMRFAVVHEGPEPKTIVTKLQRIQVVVPEGAPNVAFTLIEEELSFPMPRGGDIDSYIVYIGFDPNAVREQPRRPERRPPPRRNPA
jgi:hypothetical protein